MISFWYSAENAAENTMGKPWENRRFVIPKDRYMTHPIIHNSVSQGNSGDYEYKFLGKHIFDTSSFSFDDSISIVLSSKITSSHVTLNGNVVPLP